MSDKIVEIYTDGACSGNPGPGGWGAILKYSGSERELSGYELNTTNNRMEVLAAIQALEALQRPVSVRLYTDSRYLRDGITLWVHRWKNCGWKTADNKPVKNQDLWVKLLDLTSTLQVEWIWVKGHDGHPENERADFLARNAIIGAMVESA